MMAKKSLLDLAQRLEKRAAKLEQEASRLAILTAETILIELITKTPVDTSNALSNWQVGIGTPVTAEIKPYFPGYLGSTRKVSSKVAIDEGLYRLHGKKPGVTIYISNLAPYIVDLNKGSSAQAPAGYVEAAVMRGKKKLRQTKLKL